VNAHVHELAQRLESSSADSEPWKFMCECGDPHCHEQVWLTLNDYKMVRRRSEPILADGHHPPPPSAA
jgi:hypothetical protein